MSDTSVSEPIRLRTYRDRTGRRITKAADDQSAQKISDLAKRTAIALQPRISPSVFGCEGKRHLLAAIERVWEARLIGAWLVTFDIAAAFESVDMRKLIKIIQPYVTADDLHLLATHEDRGRYSPRINENGLPQGLSPSSLLWGVYISNRLKTLLKRFNVVLYVDDGVAICKSSDEARRFKAAIGKALAAIGMELSRKAHKKITITAPGKQLAALGVVFNAAGIAAGKSGALYAALIYWLQRGNRRAKVPNSYVGDLMPMTTLDPSDGATFAASPKGVMLASSPSGHTYPLPAPKLSAYMRERRALALAERTIIFRCVRQELHDFPPRGYAFKWAVSRTWPAEELINGRVDDVFVGWPIVSTFIPTQIFWRKQATIALAQRDHFSEVERLYESFQKSSIPQAAAGSQKQSNPSKASPFEDLLSKPPANLAKLCSQQEGRFRAFLKELWARAICFYPADTLTGMFYGFRLKKVTPRLDGTMIQDFFMNELRIINQATFFGLVFDQAATPNLPIEKMRQYLRGIAIIRAIELRRGARIKWRHWMLAAVGTIAWPAWYELDAIRDLISAFNNGKIHRSEFNSRIDLIRQRLKGQPGNHAAAGVSQ